MKGHKGACMEAGIDGCVMLFTSSGRLARPNSPWARLFYGDAKLATASAMYPDAVNRSAAGDWGALAALVAVIGAVVVLDLAG